MKGTGLALAGVGLAAALTAGTYLARPAMFSRGPAPNLSSRWPEPSPFDVPTASASASSSALPPAPTRTPVDFSLGVGATVRMEGRVAHPALLAGAPQESYLLLELDADPSNEGRSPSIDLSIVVDSSPERGGADRDTAIRAALEAVAALRDGDSVSVVAFGEHADVALKPTVLDGASRPRVEEAIRSIRSRGGACLSCGVDEGLHLLRDAIASRSSTDVQRMIVLSSRAPARGATEIADLRALADKARGVRVAVSTYAIGTDADSAGLEALAVGSNGRHAFADTPEKLADSIKEEARSVDRIVAARSVVFFDFAPGVELVSVADRPFRKTGSRVSMALGDFTPGERKTVLLKIQVPGAPRGPFNVATVRLRYGDVTRQLDMADNAVLGVDFVSEQAKVSLLDGIFLERIQRSETRTAIDQALASVLAAEPDQAKKRIEDALRDLDDRRAKAAIAATPPRAHLIDRSFAEQARALDRVAKSLAAAKKATPEAADAERRKALLEASAYATRWAL